MINSIEMKVLKVTQKDEEFFIGKMSAKDLISISTIYFKSEEGYVDNKYINEIKKKLDGYDINENSIATVQRKIQLKRLNEIAKYIEENGNLFPNSLIIAINNIDSEENDGYFLEEISGDVYRLTIDANKINTFIVDGQHRLASFAFIKDKSIIEKVELPVSIFLDMAIPIQAELFTTINSKQKPVNKSLIYDLSEYQDDNAIRRCHSLAKWFNNKDYSPLYKQIKMLGSGPNGMISQSAFIDAILPYVKDSGRKKFLSKLDDENLIKVIFLFLDSLKTLFGEQWNNTEQYLHLKATGFTGIMKLFYDLFCFSVLTGDELNNDFYKKTLSNKSAILNCLLKDNYDKVGGGGIQSKIYKELHRVIFDNKGLIYKIYFGLQKREFTTSDLKEWVESNNITNSGEKYQLSGLESLLSNSDISNNDSSNKNRKLLKSVVKGEVKSYSFSDEYYNPMIIVK